MAETDVIDPQVAAPAPDAPQGGDSGTKPADPFVLDENSLASLSPEQRAGLDPILDTWKKRANEEISNREKSVTSRFKPMEEKATAFDNLSKWQPFQQWWVNQQRTAQAGASPSQSQAIEQTKATDVATNEEWQNALYELSQGDSSKLNQLQARTMAALAAPFVQQTTEKLQRLETEREFDALLRDHPDAKELDKIGLDDNKEGTSILEFCLEWAENNRKPLEDGYKMARRWADGLSVGAKQAAMGMVNDKKGTVTQGPSTSSASKNYIEVDNVDELLRRSMEAELEGKKDLVFQVKKGK